EILVEVLRLEAEIGLIVLNVGLLPAEDALDGLVVERSVAGGVPEGMEDALHTDALRERQDPVHVVAGRAALLLDESLRECLRLRAEPEELILDQDAARRSPAEFFLVLLEHVALVPGVTDLMGGDRLSI